jgi:sorting nexin-41/42
MTTSKDLTTISSAIQADLDRFQRQKIHDMREMFLAYARHHVKWCETVCRI